MKIILIYFLLLLNILAAYEIDRKDEIRKLFYYSVESIDSLKKFSEQLKNSKHSIDESFLIAYNGAYLTLVAKHSLNPYTKYYKLKEGLELLEQAIKQKPDNLEYRFIRLSVLNYVPSFLGFDDKFFEDYRKTIELLRKKDFTQVDWQKQKGMIEFLLRSKKLNSTQKSELKTLYKEFE